MITLVKLVVRTLSQGEPICSGGINFLSGGLPSVLTHRVLHGVEACIFVISLCQSKDILVKLKEGFFCFAGLSCSSTLLLPIMPSSNQSRHNGMKVQ